MPLPKQGREPLVGKLVSTRARVVAGAAVLIAGRAVSVLSAIVLARGLGADGYGVYVYALSVIGLLIVLADLGMPTLTLREIASNAGGAHLPEILRIGPWIVFAFSVFIASIAAFSAYLLRPYLETLEIATLLVALSILPFWATAKIWTSALKGLGHTSSGQFFEMVFSQAVACLAVSIAFLWEPMRTPEVAMFILLAATATMILLTSRETLRHYPTSLGSGAPPIHPAILIRSSLPFVLVSGALATNSLLDILILGWFRPAEEVGVYRIAAQVAIFTGFGLQVLNAVMAPRFAALIAAGDQAALRSSFVRSQMVSAAVATSIAGVILLFGKTILVFAFGDQYAEGYLPLAVLTIGYLVNACFGPVGVLLTMSGEERLMIRALWTVVVLNVCLNLLLIAPFGLLGAATATALCQALFHFIFWNVAQRKLFRPTRG